MMLYDHDISRLEEIQQFICNSLAEEITVSSLSMRYGISRPTLKRHFRIHFNMGVHQFITIRRLEKAAQLILMDKKTINDAAMLVGYKDASSFGRAFKLQFGITPLELRKRTNETR